MRATLNDDDNDDVEKKDDDTYSLGKIMLSSLDDHLNLLVPLLQGEANEFENRRDVDGNDGHVLASKNQVAPLH